LGSIPGIVSGRAAHRSGPRDGWEPTPHNGAHNRARRPGAPRRAPGAAAGARSRVFLTTVLERSHSQREDFNQTRAGERSGRPLHSQRVLPPGGQRPGKSPPPCGDTVALGASTPGAWYSLLHNQDLHTRVPFHSIPGIVRRTQGRRQDPVRGTAGSRPAQRCTQPSQASRGPAPGAAAGPAAGSSFGIARYSTFETRTNRAALIIYPRHHPHSASPGGSPPAQGRVCGDPRGGQDQPFDGENP
jgi:hypothetical protein